jgi:hypothetical protein
MRWLLVCLALAVEAQAAVVGASELEALARAAQVVVRGKVLSVEARWDEKHRAIHTYARVEVVERLKGGGSTVVEVRQPGGVVGPLGQHVAGAAAFRVGEETVLFLEPVGSNVFTLTALSAGKVLLEGARARRELAGLAIPAGGKRLRSLGHEDLGERDAVLRRIRLACASRRAK